jgi:hypothetical protein
MQRTNLVIMLAALVAGAPSAYAQAQKSAPAAGPTGGVVVASEPGKAAVMATIEVTANITAIDKAARMVTLKGPKRTVEIVAGDEVKNFDQLKVGDNVTVKFVEALTLELKKTTVKPDIKADVAAVRATPGAKPGGAVGRQITIIAEVVMVDPENSIIALKGPQGRVVELPVQNKDQFKVVKKGDQVEVVYTEAVALAVTPAAAKPANAKK